MLRINCEIPSRRMDRSVRRFVDVTLMIAVIVRDVHTYLISNPNAVGSCEIVVCCSVVNNIEENYSIRCRFIYSYSCEMRLSL